MVYPAKAWDEMALTRARRIMKRERVMSQHMLESKISEAGPGGPLAPGTVPAPPGPLNMRAEPTHVTNAKRALLREGVIYQIPETMVRALGLSNPPPLYAHDSVDMADLSPPDQRRLTDVVAGYQVYLSAAYDQASCGDILEAAVDRAARAAPQVAVLGGPGRAIDVVVNGALIKGTADHVIVVAGELVIVEDKNKRAWLHPTSYEVWQLLTRCLETNGAVVPVLVARKVSPALLVFFAAIGALAFQTNNQLFRPDLRSEFVLVVKKAGLNFFDIRFDTSEVEGRLMKYFSRTVPRQVEPRSATFQAVAPILRPYLGHVTKSGGLDFDAYKQLRRELGLDPEEDFPDDYDDYDPRD